MFANPSNTVAEYLAGLPEDRRAKVKRLRTRSKSAIKASERASRKAAGKR